MSDSKVKETEKYEWRIRTEGAPKRRYPTFGDDE